MCADRFQGITGNPAPQDLEDEELEEKSKPDQDQEQDRGEDKYAGKSAEELRALLREMESNAGKREQELGELRKAVREAQEEARRALQEVQLRTMPIQQQLEYQQRLRAEEAEKEAESQVDETAFDFTKPASSTLRLAREAVQREIERLRQEQAAQNYASYREYAKKNYELGYTRAYRQDPELFKGIEQDVQNAMYAAFAGNKISAEDLGNEQMWALIARNVRWMRGEEDVRPRRSPSVKSTGNVPSEVKETPPGSSSTDIKFDEKTYQMMKAFGLTEEEAKKIIQEERTRGGL